MSLLKNDLFQTDYDSINQLAETVEPGANGLLFLPYFSGERTPHRDPKARGAFFGLSGIHSKKHLMRSVFEGVSFGLKDSLELIKNMGVQPKQIRATGGGSKSALWRQILADIFNNEVVTMQSDEGPAYGAALIAGVGCGVFENLEQAVSETVGVGASTYPEAKNAERYNEIYPLFTSLYKSLKNDYAKAFEIFNQ